MKLRIETVMERLRDYGLELPAPEHRLKRIRGIGADSVKLLRERGLVYDEYIGVPWQARRWLDAFAIKNPEQARRAIEVGQLRLGLKGYGPWIHREICRWAGVPLPAPPPKPQVICPHCGKDLSQPAPRRPGRHP